MIKDRSLKIGVVCGEHSGDTLGAHLISELKKHKDIEGYRKCLKRTLSKKK